MVTLGMDLCHFELNKPGAKLHKSITPVTIFLLIGNPWWILHVPLIVPISYVPDYLAHFLPPPIYLQRGGGAEYNRTSQIPIDIPSLQHTE